MKKLAFNILALVIIFSLFSCADTKTVDELIEEGIQKKISELKHRKKVECWDYIYEEAEILVDSIMYREIGNTMNDTLLLPDRPERPDDSSGYQVELDSSGINTIWVDSLHPANNSKSSGGNEIDSIRTEPIDDHLQNQ